MHAQKFSLSNRLHKCTPPLILAQAPLLVIAARSGPSRRLSLAVQAAKGFGKPKLTPVSTGGEEGPSKGRKGKAKRVQLQPGNVGPIPNQQRQQESQNVLQAQFQAKLLAPDQVSEEEDEFMARLQALKEHGKERAAAAAAVVTGNGAAAAATVATAAAPAIFDAVPAASGAAGAAADAGSGSIYTNPPPLSQTLLAAAGGGADASDISDPKLRDANIGPSQLGLAAGAIIFIAIFVIVAAGDYAPSSRRYSGIRPAQSVPDPIEEKILKTKISLYEDQLKADPNNDDATGALATSYARLMQYDKASDLLEKLSKRTTTDAEVWRLLGESSLLSQQPRKAVSAFERAVELRRQQAASTATAAVAVTQPDLQLLTGLVDAYIANNDYAKAIDALRDVRQEILSKVADSSSRGSDQLTAAAAAAATVAPQVLEEDVRPAEGLLAADASVSVTAPEMLTAPSLTDGDGGAAPAASTSTSSPPPQPESSTVPTAAPAVAAVRPLDPVGVELLTAKVYSAWRGHDQDALATYDELIKAFPEEYRGYLAKGVFLKEKGRKADAERMFLQARFFAPASKQQLVRAIAETKPAAPQLPDNN